MIGIIVANVPEGLLPQMTYAHLTFLLKLVFHFTLPLSCRVALTLTAKKMLDLGVLVSNLEIIETLGKHARVHHTHSRIHHTHTHTPQSQHKRNDTNNPY